jgi:hypothetical protein
MELIEVFRFLAQSNEEMSLQLPDYDEDFLYRRRDGDGFFEDIPIPAKAAGMTCLTLIHERFTLASTEELALLMNDIACLLTIMDELPPRQSEYLWLIDKNKYMISGPYDSSWSILRRMAVQALRLLGDETRSLPIPFDEFIKLGGFSRWKIVPTFAS